MLYCVKLLLVLLVFAPLLMPVSVSYLVHVMPSVALLCQYIVSVSPSRSVGIMCVVGFSGTCVLVSLGASPFCVGFWFVVNVYVLLRLQFPSVALTYQVYVVAGCSPVMLQLLVPLVSLLSLLVPMLGVVSMVQLNVSASGSSIVISSVVVLAMQCPVLSFVGVSAVIVGHWLACVVKLYVWLVQLHPSVMLALQ